MKTATVREVQHNLNKVLAWVADGQSVTITKHKETVAKLVPAKRKNKAVEWPDFGARLKKIYPEGSPRGKSVSQIISGSREERF